MNGALSILLLLRFALKVPEPSSLRGLHCPEAPGGVRAVLAGRAPSRSRRDVREPRTAVPLPHARPNRGSAKLGAGSRSGGSLASGRGARCSGSLGQGGVRG